MPSAYHSGSISLDIFREAGLQINSDKQIKSDFAILFFENGDSVSDVKEYMAQHEVPGPNLDLVNKELANQLYEQAGFPVLNTLAPMSIQDVENFPSDYIFLKPKQGLGGKPTGSSPAQQLAYCTVSKHTLLSVLAIDSEFFENQKEEKTQHLIQEAVNPETKEQEFFMISGAVNGKGELYLEPTIKSIWNYSNRARTGLGTCSFENDTPDMVEYKTYFANLIKNCNIKNCIVNLQLLKQSNGKLVPIDFQYRITYHIRLNLKDSIVRAYAKDLIRFTYDMTPAKPVFWFSTAVKSSKSNIGKDDIKVTIGNSKQEALSKI